MKPNRGVTALKDTPVVMVTGPRQCGKTALVRDLVAGNREFITMDDDGILAGAGRGNRTPKGRSPADFESAASASSAIPALLASA
jgi:hypothetical protein